MPQVFRTGAELAESVGFEKIIEGGIRERLTHQSALPGLARAKEENGLVPGDLPEVENPFVHFGNHIAGLHVIWQVHCRFTHKKKKGTRVFMQLKRGASPN